VVLLPEFVHHRCELVAVEHSVVVLICVQEEFLEPVDVLSILEFTHANPGGLVESVGLALVVQVALEVVVPVHLDFDRILDFHLEELVVECIVNGDAVIGVFFEQALDESLGLHGDGHEFRMVKGEFFGADILYDLFVGFPRLRGLSRKHDLEQDAQTPHVILLVLELVRKEFGCHLEGSAYDARREIEAFDPQAKVDQLTLEQITVLEHHILGFYVAVDDAS